MTYEVPHVFSAVKKILESGEPLYVRNLSKHRTTGVTSILVIDYPSPEGGRSFNVPQTSIPFNICDEVDAQSLVGSDSFRRAFNNGALEIVSPDEAESVLSDPSMRDSLRKSIYASDNKTIHNARISEIRANEAANEADKAERMSTNGAAMAPMLAAMDPKVAAMFKSVSSNPQPENHDEAQPVVASSSPAKHRLDALKLRTSTGVISTENVLSELLTLYGDMSEDDIMSVAADPAWPEEAKRWAQERLAFRYAQRERAAQASQTTA